MKKGFLTLVFLLTFSLWIASQPIIGEGTASIDSEVPINVAPGGKVLVDSFLIPLWYTTILQYEKSKVINDSLTRELVLYEQINEKLIQDFVTQEQQKDLLLEMLAGRTKQDSLQVIQSHQQEVRIKRQKFYIKTLSIVAVSLGILAVF